MPLDSSDLAHEGALAAERIAACIASGGSITYCQLMASRVHEQLKRAAEFAVGEEAGRLRTALRQFKLSGSEAATPALILTELRAAMLVLQSSDSLSMPNGRPEFRVIQGGLV